MTNQRGSRKPLPDLGRPHRRERARLLTRHIDGTPCPCLTTGDCGPGCPCKQAGHGLPMYRDPNLNADGAPLEADHELSRAMGGRHATRLLLRVCNRSRGDGTRVGRGDADGEPEWPINPHTGTHCPPWWTRDWTGGIEL